LEKRCKKHALFRARLSAVPSAGGSRRPKQVVKVAQIKRLNEETMPKKIKSCPIVLFPCMFPFFSRIFSGFFHAFFANGFVFEIKQVMPVSAQHTTGIVFFQHNAIIADKDFHAVMGMDVEEIPDLLG
jgi:hypothetical protein